MKKPIFSILLEAGTHIWKGSEAIVCRCEAGQDPDMFNQHNHFYNGPTPATVERLRRGQAALVEKYQAEREKRKA